MKNTVEDTKKLLNIIGEFVCRNNGSANFSVGRDELYIKLMHGRRNVKICAQTENELLEKLEAYTQTY